MHSIFQRKCFLTQNHGAKSNLFFTIIFYFGYFYVIGTICVLVVIKNYRSPADSSPVEPKNDLHLRRSLRDISQVDKYVARHKQQLTQKAFPVHSIDDGTEEIPHPGIAFSGVDRIKALMPDFDFPELLTVPKFWNPKFENDQSDVREFLGNYGERLMEPDEAAQIGSWKDGKETIFVSIASYRDSECQSTVESLFLRAEFPERIRVAVVDQIEEGDTKCGEPKISCDQDPGQALCKYKHLVDIYEVEAYLMVGPVLARHIAHRMYRGEYFALQVDAHVRFTEGWDEDIISQWQSANNEMAVLSTYLTDIGGSIDPITNKSLREDRNMMCKIQYDGTGKHSRLVLKAPSNGIPAVKESPMLHPFWSAGFSFSRGHFIVQVPYDQHLPMLFQGEESSIVIRGFTYGYDFYAPERSVAFHLYAVKDNISRRNRHKFWENETLYIGALEKSTARLNGITGLSGNVRKDFFRHEEKKYGLGNVRDKDIYFKTFGIYPETKTVDGRLCNFVTNDMHERFSKHLRQNRMGIDYNTINFSFQD